MKRTFLLLFAVLHLVIGICSLLVTISIASLEGKFNSGCGVFGEVEPSGGNTFLYKSSTPYSTCQFLKWMPAIGFVISLILMVYHLYPAIAREPRFTVQTTVCWVIMIVIGFLLFVSSCIISAGFQKSCNEIAKVYKQRKDMSCKEAYSFSRFDGKPEDPSIYTFLTLAEGSCWAAFLTSVVCITISSLNFFWKSCRDLMS